jgi:ribosomal protein L37AE/L43A
MRFIPSLNTSKESAWRRSFIQILDQNDVYYNFINSLDSKYTKKYYKFCLEKFLSHYKLELTSFLKLTQDEMSNLIIKYVVDKKISKQYKNLMSASLKHACEISDVVLTLELKIKPDDCSICRTLDDSLSLVGGCIWLCQNCNNFVSKGSYWILRVIIRYWQKR